MTAIPPLDAWNLTGTPEPLPGGHRNTVLRVGHHVLKSTRRSEAAITWLLPVARYATQYGLRVPTPLRARTGTYVVDGWTCEPYYPGAPTAPSMIRARMRTFHARTTTLPQRPGFLSCGALVRAPRGGDVDLRPLPGAMQHAIRAAWTALPPAQHTVVHGDLNASNVLTDPQGRITLIDWDEARLDHPGFDRRVLGPVPDATRRAALAWEIASCWALEPQRARTLARQFARAFAP